MNDSVPARRLPHCCGGFYSAGVCLMLTLPPWAGIWVHADAGWEGRGCSPSWVLAPMRAGACTSSLLLARPLADRFIGADIECGNVMVGAYVGTPRAVAALAMCRPTPVDPVNVMASTSEWLTIRSPTSEPPMSTLSTPGGRPAVVSAWARWVEHRHCARRLPHHRIAVISAGAIFHAGMAIGNWVIAGTIPMGLRVTKICSPARRKPRGSIDLACLTITLVAVVPQNSAARRTSQTPSAKDLAFLDRQIATSVVSVVVDHVGRGAQQGPTRAPIGVSAHSGGRLGRPRSEPRRHRRR